MITSRPYRIAGVAGFHGGMKPPGTGLSRPERRLKPIPHKNVGSSRIDHDLNMRRDTNASGRHLDSTATKSLARRTRAVAQVTTGRKHNLLVNQRGKWVIAPDVLLKVVSCENSQIDSAAFANIVFGKTSSNKYYNLNSQHSECVLVVYDSPS